MVTNKTAVFALAILLSSVGVVFATSTNTTTNLTVPTNVSNADMNQLESQAGLLPNNPFYFLKTGLENLQLFLTFDQAKKAEMESQIAQNRLAELALAQKLNLTNLIPTITNSYEKAVNRTQEDFNNVGNQTVKILSEKVTEDFNNFNESVTQGRFPQLVNITDNTTLDTLSQYTNQTSFNISDLRDLVYTFITEAKNSTDWSTQKSLIQLSERLMHQAMLTINPRAVMSTENDTEKIDQLALKIGSDSAQRVAVLNRVMEREQQRLNSTDNNSTDSKDSTDRSNALKGLENALNASQDGRERAMLAITNRLDSNSKEIGDLAQRAQNFTQQLRDRIQSQLEAQANLRERLRERLGENANLTALGNGTLGNLTAGLMQRAGSGTDNRSGN